jgi:hypothetical protein
LNAVSREIKKGTGVSMTGWINKLKQYVKSTPYFTKLSPSARFEVYLVERNPGWLKHELAGTEGRPIPKDVWVVSIRELRKTPRKKYSGGEFNLGYWFVISPRNKEIVAVREFDIDPWTGRSYPNEPFPGM